MYKVASDGRQRALHRGKPWTWAGGEDRPATLGEQLDQLQEGMRIIEARILALPKGEERKTLGVQKFEMQTQANTIKKALNLQHRSKEGLPQFFVDAAKEILTKGTFETIYRTAQRMHEQAQKDADASLTSTLDEDRQK